MSFLEKIRKNTWLIFLFIGISLVFFVLDPNILLKFFSENSNVIGKVNGDNISFKEYFDNFQFLKRFREGESDSSLKNDVWKLLVHEKVLTQQAMKLGIQSTKRDFWKAIEKQSIYSKIYDFQDEKGNMDIKKFQLYLKNLEKLSIPQAEEEKNIWNYEKKNILKKIVAKKYVEMLMYGLNTSFIEAELNSRDKNYFSIIDYVFIPYSEIEKKYHPIKNYEIYDYIKKNKFFYKTENLRNLSFVILRSHPSLDDEKNMDNKIRKLFQELKSSDHHSMIVSNQSERPFDSNFYLKKNLPPILQDFVEKNNRIGSMFGPVKENNIYIMAKLTGKKMVHNSVLFSHILISHKEAVRSSNQRSKKKAENIAKKIYNTVQKNPYQFDALVMKKSDDFIKNNKGNLGWMKYEEQNNLKKLDIFSSENKKGTIAFTETKFGYHILRIEDQKDLKPVYQFSIIIKTLVPSKKTEDLLHKNAVQFIKQNKNSNLNTLINNARIKKYETVFLETVKNYQWNIHGLNTELDKEIINWSYEKNRKEGDFKVFYTSNRDYIIVFLSKIQKKGYPIEEIKNNLIPLLINKKIHKNLIKYKFYNKNLEDIAVHFSKKINKSCRINFYNSMIGEYKEPKVVGSAFSSKLYKTSNPILGKKGLFFVRPLKRFNTSKKLSYSEVEFLNSFLRKNVLEKLGDVLIKKSKIKDYRKDI
ncbi:peptidylprolyl isomerase [Blattabacterium sp. (Blattella germanica) str. Bge]|uniref:SurA N-terminal domain-containing protein n=1 Tax=Blattabacterium sp. (Blattella germanica) TaxID=624186 RepID=UPI0001BB60B3|nr:SurA N-terminal domain-containing protein [Blattabacterium sp. (Blattella germanica)]ACY40125.1 peptidylprolyl isomerase [Blattabacterium sp. (Blattella germanica) str. Bge]